MNRKSPISPLRILSDKEVTTEKFNEVVRSFNQLLLSISNPGDVVCSSLTLLNLPYNGYGLPTGGVYRDSGGSLWTTQEGEAFAPSFIARYKMGTVTTSE